MLKTIGIESKWNIIFDKNFNDFVPKFFSWYHDFKVFNKKTKEFIEVNEKSIWEYIDRSVINITPFSFYDVDKENNKVSKISNIENTELPYTKWIINLISLWSSLINMRWFYDTNILGKRSSIISNLSWNYSSSRAKKSKEIYAIIEESVNNNLFFKENDEKDLVNIVFHEKELDNWNSIKIKLSVWDKQINVELKTKSWSKFYDKLNWKEFKDIISSDEDISELVKTINKEFIDNKEVIIWRLNWIILNKKKAINDLLSTFLSNEVIVKEKSIIRRVSDIKEDLESMNILDYFTTDEWSVFDEVAKDELKSIKYAWGTDAKILDSKDNTQDLSNEEIFDILHYKQTKIVWDYRKSIEEIETVELLKWNIKSVELVKEEEVSVKIWNDLLDLINEDIKEVETNLKTLSEKYKIDPKKIETKLIFEKLALTNTNDVSSYTTQVERSKAFANSISTLTEISNLHKTLTSYSLDKDNITDFKDKVSVYKTLSDTLLSSYSWEGWLLMTKEVITSVLSYIALDTTITETEEYFYKEFLYSNTWKLLSYLSQTYIEKQDKDKENLVNRNLTTMKSLDINENSLYKLSIVLNNILDWLSKSNVELDDLEWFKISNISWNGSYYTPNSFGNFLKPFTENNSFLYQVNVLDSSCWKGTLLNYLDWNNIKKIWNDINPLSLKILKYTQWFNYDKILELTDINEIRKFITSSNLITTNTTSLAYMDYNIEADFILSNPPYLNGLIWSKERENILKDNKIKNISNWRVNMVEYTYKWLINKLKLGWMWMLISSARWISKIEQKVRLDSDNYLVPLYRVWVSWKPFKKEWVLLAPISISGDDVYVFDEDNFKKEEAEAEFFVTLYTRLNKRDQEEFSNVAPTILIHHTEIEEFNNFVSKNLSEVDLLSNYKNYFDVSRKIKLEEINNFFKEKYNNSPISIPEDNISEEEFIKLVEEVKNINEFLEFKNIETKSINKIKYLKASSTITLKINDLLDQFRKIDERLIPLIKEALKWHINSNSLKITLKKEFWLDFNWYSFNINKESKIKKIGNKFMFGDKNITNLLTFPYPYSLHTLPLNTYSEVFSRYLTGLSSDDKYLSKKIKELDSIFTEFLGFNKKTWFKVIEKIWNLEVVNPEILSKFFIKEKNLIIWSNNSWINELVDRIIKIEKWANRDNVENFLYFIRQNTNKYDQLVSNFKKYNYTIKSFTHWYKLKYQDRNLIEQSKLSVVWITNYIKKYSVKNKTKVFDDLFIWKYTNSISLLNNLWKILISEFDKWDNHFWIVESFKKGNSLLLKEFSCIDTYTNYKDLIKVDRYFRDISFIDEAIDKIDTEIDFLFNNSTKDINFKKFLNELKFEIKKDLELNTNTWFNSGELAEYVKNSLIKSKYIDKEKLNNLKSDIDSIESNINEIWNKQIRELYLLNTTALKNNLKWVISIEKNISLMNDEDCKENYYASWNLDKVEFIKDVRSVLKIDSEDQVEISKYNLKPIKNLFYENINKWIIEEIKTLWEENPLSLIINEKIQSKFRLINNFKDIQKWYYMDSIERDVMNLQDEKNMLLDIYKNKVSDDFISNYKSEVVYIDEIVSFYRVKEISLQSDMKEEEKKEIESYLNYAKFLTINTNEYERIIILDYIKTYSNDISSIDNYIENNIHRFALVNKENIKNHIIEKNRDFDVYWSEMAESIVMSLWVKSNYSKLYSNIFLDLESKLLRENDKENLFKAEFIKFLEYLETKSPYQEVIQLSTKYAELLNQKSLLRKKEPLIKDLLEIETISDYVLANDFNDIWDSELVEIIRSNSDLRKNANKTIDSNIRDIEISLNDKESLITNNKTKLLPTFVQSKALYKFNKSLKNNNWLIKLLNQSEVWTWKTFTMPFYESLLDDNFESEQNSFKLYITEANLVSNTSKSLIENWIMPSDILEWKISNLVEINKIIKFVRKWWTSLILSNASLYNFDVDNIKILTRFLAKNVWNIYLYADEATFLKNTETNSYSWFKILLSQLKKTKKLRLQNYLTATPVNNDNWDFLYLLELFNKKDILKYIKGISLSPKGKLNLFNLMSKTDNLKLWRKETVHVSDDRLAYYYVPNIVYLLEFIRTGSEYSLESFNMNNTMEVDDKFDSSKKTYVTYKKYYEEFWISFKEISLEDYENPKFIFDNPLFFNSKTEKLAFNLINLFKNLNIVNFDRNLNSIGLKWSTSQLYKTYYSLSPSLIESMIIENFISEIWRVQKFKKISNAIWKVKKQHIYDLEDLFSTEWINIFNNLVLEVWSIIGMEMKKENYFVRRKIKRWYKEVEESISYNLFTVDRNLLVESLNNNDWNDYILNNKLIDNVLMNIDIISYSNYKNKVKELSLLESKWVNSSLIKKEEKERDKYLSNIYTVLWNFINTNINTNIGKEELILAITDKLKYGDTISTVKNTYIESPETLLWELEWFTKQKGFWQSRIINIYDNLQKNSSGWALSERSYIIQLLEDFNTPLWAIFIEKVIRNMTLEGKEKGVDIKLKDKDILKIKNYIISNWNTLSWTLNHLAVDNSKKNVNTFITTNYVNTVLNLYKEVKKNSDNVFMITWKYVKSSKEKLKIINDFDKLDEFWKTLIATSKSVEKWLSIFNALKWYTTIWDENAWALTQRIGRFRTLMDKQLWNLDDYCEKIENWEIKIKEEHKKSYLDNIKTLKENKKEFFILSNKLSESMLQTSEVKNILLQKVNSTSMFNWIIDFNDEYFWNSWTSFNVANVLDWVKKIIEKDKIKFFEKLWSYNKTIEWELLFLEINKNIKRNINKNIDNIKSIEGIKIPSISKNLNRLHIS
jgi:hypothetical protein